MADQFDITLYDANSSPWMQKHPGLGVDVMQHVYNRMAAKYPRLWEQSFPSAKAITEWKMEWAESFDEHKMTPKDIVAGLKRVTTLYPDYPPTIGQFLRCCRYIDEHAAFVEALEQMHLRTSNRDKWSHPAIYWAAIKFGEQELRTAAWARVEKRWSDVLRSVLDGGPFDPVPPLRGALPAPGSATLTHEEVKARVKAIRERFKVRRQQRPLATTEEGPVVVLVEEPATLSMAGAGGLLAALNARTGRGGDK